MLKYGKVICLSYCLLSNVNKKQRHLTALYLNQQEIERILDILFV